MRMPLRKRRLGLASALAATIVLPLAAAGAGVAQAAPGVLPYLDESLPYSVRAADLVSRMTLEEKAQQFASTLYSQQSTTVESEAAGGPVTVGAAPAIPRLGVPTYDYWSEALHGVARTTTATEFPTSLGLSATWDRDLINASTAAIADEARSKTNDCLFSQVTLEGSTQWSTSDYTLWRQCKGLTYWSPTVNLARDPRWGRADESYGEDPFLAAEMAGQFVQGLQGDVSVDADAIASTDTYLKAVSTPKHYLANNSEVNRHNGSSNLTDRSLHEYYTAQFGKLLGEYGAASTMSSYNATNVIPHYEAVGQAPTFDQSTDYQDYSGLYAPTEFGTPQSANEYTMDTLLRRLYGFDGFVTSDCGATEDVYQIWPAGHSWAAPELGRQVKAYEGSSYSLKAGTDVDCFSADYPYHMTKAQTTGLSPEQVWDVSLTRAFAVRMQLGEFDASGQVPWKNTDYTSAKQVGTAEHLALAHQVSLESPTLLKNDGTLPLSVTAGAETVVLGHYATNPIHGGYSPAATSIPTLSASSQIQQYVESKNGQYTVYPDAITGGLGSNPTVGAIQFRTDLGSANAGVVASIAATTLQVQGTQGDGAGYFFKNSFSGTPSFSVNPNRLGGMFWTQPVDIPATASYLRLTLSGADYVSAVDPTCLSGIVYSDAIYGNPGCDTEGTFDVTIGGVTVQYPVQAAQVQNVVTTAVSYRYLPLDIDLATDFPSAAGTTQTVTFVFNAFGSDGSSLSDPGVILTYDGNNTVEQQIRDAENVIVYLGTRESDSNEEADRPTVDLPRQQAELAAWAAELNPNTVVYIQSVGQISVTPFKDKAAGILWTTYNGQYQGQAAAELLFNQNVLLENGKRYLATPSGKLTYTWYSDVEAQLGPTADGGSADYRISQSEGSTCGRTYWYYTSNCGVPDYVFGHGLSYGQFTYSNLSLSTASVTPNDTVTATVTVKNDGAIAGRETVELYAASPLADGSNRPYKQLKGFVKTDVIQPGQSVTVSIELPADELWFWDTPTQKRVWDQGVWSIQVAGSSATGAGLLASLTLSGERKAGIDVVAAIPDGTTLNLLTPDNRINPFLSVTRNDQSFYDLKDVAVTYTYDSAVVDVDPKTGAVKAVGEGQTLVEITVTADGETKSTSFPVIVHANNDLITSAVMDRMSTKGRVAPANNPDEIEYGNTDGPTKFDYLVNFGDPQPTLAQANLGVQLTANAVGVQGRAVDSYQFLIAPMDLNECAAEVTAGGLLKATTDKDCAVEVTVVATVAGVSISQSVLVHIANVPQDDPTTDPTAPATTDPTAPATTDPTAPATTDPTAPATTDPTVPPTKGPDKVLPVTGANTSALYLAMAAMMLVVAGGALITSSSLRRRPTA